MIFFRNFDEIRKRFETYFKSINKYNLSYSIEKTKFGIFLGKKKYIIEKNGNLKVKGMCNFNEYGNQRGGIISLN